MSVPCGCHITISYCCQLNDGKCIQTRGCHCWRYRLNEQELEPNNQLVMLVEEKSKERKVNKHIVARTL